MSCITSSLPSPAKQSQGATIISQHQNFFTIEKIWIPVWRLTGVSAFWFNDEQFTVGWNTPMLLMLNKTGWVLKNLMKVQPNLARTSNALSGEERLWQSSSASAGIASVSHKLSNSSWKETCARLFPPTLCNLHNEKQSELPSWLGHMGTAELQPCWITTSKSKHKASSYLE